MKCSSKFFTYELSRANTMVVGLASTFRAIHGAPTIAAAPAVSFRKSRRPGWDWTGRFMTFPLIGEAMSHARRRAQADHGHVLRSGRLDGAGRAARPGGAPRACAGQPDRQRRRDRALRRTHRAVPGRRAPGLL